MRFPPSEETGYCYPHQVAPLFAVLATFTDSQQMAPLVCSIFSSCNPLEMSFKWVVWIYDTFVNKLWSIMDLQNVWRKVAVKFRSTFLLVQVNLDMTDSMGPGKWVCHMHNPSYTYDTYYICMALGPIILSVVDKSPSYSGPLYPSSPVFFKKCFRHKSITKIMRTYLSISDRMKLQTHVKKRSLTVTGVAGCFNLWAKWNLRSNV